MWQAQATDAAASQRSLVSSVERRESNPESDGATPEPGGTSVPPPRASWWARWPGTLVRAGIAVLPLAWLLRMVHWRDVASRASQVGIRGIALALACGVGTLTVGAIRWRVMLRTYGADMSRAPGVLTLLRHNFVGQYFSVLPSGVAGEFVRAYRVQHCLPKASTSYVILFVERVAGLLGLLLVAGAGAVLSPSTRSVALARTMNVAMAVTIVFAALLFVLPQIRTRSPRVESLLEGLPVVGKVLSKIPAPRGAGGLVLVVLLSIASQLFVVMMAAALLMPLTSHASFWVCARVVPAIVLVTYIPVTPGALGQREAAFVYFFGREGVEPAAAFASSILMFAVVLGLSVIGGVVLLLERAWGVRTSPSSS